MQRIDSCSPQNELRRNSVTYIIKVSVSMNGLLGMNNFRHHSSLSALTLSNFRLAGSRANEKWLRDLNLVLLSGKRKCYLWDFLTVGRLMLLLFMGNTLLEETLLHLVWLLPRENQGSKNLLRKQIILETPMDNIPRDAFNKTLIKPHLEISIISF